MVLRKYYKNEEINLNTIKSKSLKDLDILPFDFSKFNIVVLGSGDRELYQELSEFVSPLFGLNSVKSEQLRTEKVSTIFKTIEYSKSEMRNGVEFNEGVFIFSGKNRINVPLSPDTDCYFLYPEHAKNLKKILNLDFDLPEYTLIFRDNGEEFIYLEKNNFLRVEKPDEGEIVIIGKVNKPSKKLNINFNKTVDQNRHIVEKMKKEAICFLSPFKDKKAVIPLSGGKDSQAVLDIAVNVWDREKLLCIHADTGFDFKENRNHAEYLSKEYGVNLEVLELNLNKKGEPDFSRWCTFEKTEKMYEIAKKWGAEIYLMGDRDAESSKRRRKPRKRELQGILHLFPIKFWSTAHIQVLIELSGRSINPLYKKGYWRTGCKSCPFLTQWEKILQF
ncbi:conserved hypothetical protein [Thermotomaculum hydrothermale]|uniref:Phosphoadenosine phosphosulphate reductase domain-containing protein n=2 Tax=Thermotomaculum hydrothermale TaxID=981385 RepID=A0A7R6SZJ0_9BACT|nr:conserved hypothetical protein [Thermotomaculum hydrothermale]